MNINFEQAIKMMQELRTPYIRISDARDKKIIEWTDINIVESTIDKLKEFRDALEGYGIINIVAGDEKILKSNWQNPYVWRVSMAKSSMSSTPQTTHGGYEHHKGYVSEREASLMAELNGLKMQYEFDKKLDELKKQLDEKKSFDPKDFMPYIPLVAPMLGIPPDRVNQMMGMYQTQGIAGIGKIEQPKLETQMAAEEMQAKLNNITAHLEQLIKEVGVDKVEKLIIGIAGKPHLVDTALTFL